MAEPLQLEITCRQVWKEISSYYEGKVLAELGERLKRHLEDCSHCRAIYDGLRNTVTLVADDQQANDNIHRHTVVETDNASTSVTPLRQAKAGFISPGVVSFQQSSVGIPRGLPDP